MIDIFKNWINSMLCIAIFITFIKLIMPNTNLKKYIYSLVGILTIITVISPIVNLLKDDKLDNSLKQVLSNISLATQEYSDIDETKIKEATNETVRTNLINTMKEDITSRLALNNVFVKNINIILDDEYNLQNLEVNIKKMEEDKVTLESVNEVVYYINEEYKIDYSKIVVVEEGE